MVVWMKTRDFMDGSPRYSFDNREYGSSYHKIQLVITKGDWYNNITRRHEKRYTVTVCHVPTETLDRIEGIKYLKTAQDRCVALFNRYVEKFGRD